MGILRTDRVSGLGGANAITGSVDFNIGRNKPIFLKIASDDFAVGTGDFTVEAWYYRGGLGTHNDAVGNIIVETGNQNGQNGIWLADAQGKLEGRVHYGSGSWNLDITSSSTMVNNRWYHVAMSRSGSTVRIFLDGALEASGSSSSDLTTAYSNEAYIGGQGNSEGNRGIVGYVSNARISNTALYTAAFTVPTTRLEKLSSTLLLCCQSPGNVLQEETGKTVETFVDNTDNRGPVASRFTPNSPVGFSTTTDVGTQFGSTFDGVTTFDSQAYMVPPGGNTRERNRGRAAVGGGYDGSSVRNEIEYFNIQSMGTVIDFGNLTATTFGQKSNAASSTRGIIAVGGRTPTYVNTIEFITIATTSNATDFGDISSTLSNVAASSNQTRGVTFGGRNSTNVMEFITIATVGNASDFGDLTLAKRQGASVSSPTRGVYAGGFDDTNRINNIEFITIASAGNASDFGDLTVIRQEPAGASDNTRGVFAGGYDTTPSATRYNTIDFITIASAGNATDFGDTPTARADATGTSNNTRGVFAGFNDGGNTNLMAFVTIQTTGNASDFGDLITKRSGASNCSDSHGGLS
jgi:hypothetical protein